MLIIGERINSSRPAIKAALEKKDKEHLQREARAQSDKGAQFLDVNCALSGEGEPQDMEWLVGVIREAVPTPLCIAVCQGPCPHVSGGLLGLTSFQQGHLPRPIPLD